MAALNAECSHPSHPLPKAWLPGRAPVAGAEQSSCCHGCWVTRPALSLGSSSVSDIFRLPHRPVPNKSQIHLTIRPMGQSCQNCTFGSLLQGADSIAPGVRKGASSSHHPYSYPHPSLDKMKPTSKRQSPVLSKVPAALAPCSSCCCQLPKPSKTSPELILLHWSPVADLYNKVGMKEGLSLPTLQKEKGL